MWSPLIVVINIVVITRDMPSVQHLDFYVRGLKCIYISNRRSLCHCHLDILKRQRKKYKRLSCMDKQMK